MTWFWDWQLRARCRGMDINVFFPLDDETRGDRLRRERVAKQICLGCPVLRECRSYAVASLEESGIWGATSEVDRRYLARSSPRRTGDPKTTHTSAATAFGAKRITQAHRVNSLAE
ncbi:WhiB family transcriptional regulator [Rhodococcus opacus]|uniref:Transcriptional regulator WhiB n=1 Tax=Rhodococcus opacus TaxID=37919 RepID=A0AAX3Y819_RHOOP|nr:WhiB family transcriptional regulator [Rhodococcus opacus]MCZ4588228.1 WhiB family transcriptional regulator [Rhodococcus opacus]WLF44355.1 WhiB family transcriptional regulator [Rhodococcus opacus]